MGGRLVERDERLVEQQEAGSIDEGPGERRPARHAERQARGETPAHAAEPDLGKGGSNPRRRSRPSSGRTRRRLSSTVRQGSRRGSWKT